MFNPTKHQLYLQDCVEGVKKLPNNSLSLVLSGPPYFDHVVYSGEEENLSTKNYSSFLENISRLWQNLTPKMSDGGVIALWLHDIYIKKNNIFELKPFHADIIKTMPQELVLRNILIWDRYLKKIHPDFPNDKQFGTRFQYILLFSKGLTMYEKNMTRIYWNPFWSFKATSSLLGSKNLYRLVFYIGRNGFLYKIFDPLFSKIKKNILNDIDKPKEYKTTCPPEVAETIIKNFSKQGDTICDPFLGSGTTMQVADKLGRVCIGFEINKNAKEVILKRVGDCDRIKIIE